MCLPADACRLPQLASLCNRFMEAQLRGITNKRRGNNKKSQHSTADGIPSTVVNYTDKKNVLKSRFWSQK